MHFLIIGFLFFKEIPVFQIFFTFLHGFHENFIHICLKISSHWNDSLFKFFIISFDFVLSFFNKVFHLFEGKEKLFVDLFEFFLELLDLLFRYWVTELFIELKKRFVILFFRAGSLLLVIRQAERIMGTMIHDDCAIRM